MTVLRSAVLPTMFQESSDASKCGARWAHGSRKIGPMLQSVGSIIFVSYHFVKSRINGTLNIAKVAGTHYILRESRKVTL